MSSDRLQTALDDSEITDLRSCEATIQRGLATFYEVGAALLSIRVARLYRATHTTFEGYCRERWQISRPQAYRLIEAASIAENLSPMGDIAPTSERQIRPLARLEPAGQRAVWEQAIAEANGQPTAGQVEKIAKTFKQVLEERIAARDGMDESTLSETDEPSMSRRELTEIRERMKINAERVHRLMNFVRAIETLSAPSLPLPDVAREILEMDTPDKNWRGRASAAKSHLNELVRELNR